MGQAPPPGRKARTCLDALKTHTHKLLSEGVFSTSIFQKVSSHSSISLTSPEETRLSSRQPLVTSDTLRQIEIWSKESG